jgi:hypothetical protein
MRSRITRIVLTAAALIPPSPALAQQGGSSAAGLFTNPIALAWLLGWAVAGYAFCIGFVLLFRRLAYEPNVARVGCWLGASLWALLVVFHVFGRVLGVELPTVVPVIVIVLLLLFGFVTWMTRRS